MTDPFEIHRLRKQNERLLQTVSELDLRLQDACDTILAQKKELNRIRYELAKHEGAEMMRGGREDMMREAAK
jgi:hypothetical protein